MGNCCAVEGAIDHWIYVKTGDRKGAGTDVNCTAILYDDRGNRSPEIFIDILFTNDYERGKTDVIQAPPLGLDFGNIVRMELWRENEDVFPNWFCEVIVINDRRTDKSFYFPVLRWMVSGVRYKIDQFDTSLPQYSSFKEQREQELLERRHQYQYEQKLPDLPVQIAKLPMDEQYSDSHKFDILAIKTQLLNKLGHINRVGQWNNMEEITQLFQINPTTFYEPAGVDRWSNDLCCGAQRLIGCNPTMIRLCTELPENMGITAEMLKPFLEGWTLKQIIQAKRLFKVDLRILDNLPTKDDTPVCAPIALFFVTGDKQLVPIAIQLYQDIDPKNPVFLPNDPLFTWMNAKMWFNNADAQVHQALSHIAYTHLVMEGVQLALMRNLSICHPIHKLLVPHLQFLLAINVRVNQLLAPDGWADKCFQIGREGFLELIRRGMDEWRMDHQGNLPKELETRGVLDVKTLPNYGFRDDAILVYKAIENYVLKICRIYYDDNKKLRDDYELQNFAKELSLPKEEGGIGLNGVPGNGRISRIEELQTICCCVLYTCTAQHSAVSSCQYEEYAFPPNYPSLLYGDPPIDRLPKAEEDIVNAMPDRDETLDTMGMAKVLGYKGSKSIGEFEIRYHYDPPALRVEDEFRQELKRISQTIKQRNEMRDEIYKYPFLDPDYISNSIPM